MNFALMPPAVALKPRDGDGRVETKPALPVFKRRWWFRDDRLDARPVIWSLENRPEEWEVDRRSRPLTITHLPSKHEFWVGMGGYHLWRAPNLDGTSCGCLGLTHSGETRFQRFQQVAFRRAYRNWLAWNRERRAPEVSARNNQFASHFIR